MILVPCVEHKEKRDHSTGTDLGECGPVTTLLGSYVGGKWKWRPLLLGLSYWVWSVKTKKIRYVWWTYSYTWMKFNIKYKKSGVSPRYSS